MTQPNFSTPTFIIPATGVYSVQAVGNEVQNLTAATAAGSLTISINGAQACRFDAGDTYIMDQDETFTNFLLKNTTGSLVTVQVGIAQGQIKNASAVSVQGNVNVNANIGSKLMTYVDVAVLTLATTEILVANANRKEAIISNLLVNNTVVRYGDSATAAAQGPELGIGATAIISNTAAIYIYNPAGGTIHIGNAENIT